jgi:hypothetical protein
LLAKIEDEEIQKQIDKLEANQSRQQGRKQDSRTEKKKRFSLMILQNGYA